jgi:phosphoserine aminotransferase
MRKKHECDPQQHTFCFGEIPDRSLLVPPIFTARKSAAYWSFASYGTVEGLEVCQVASTAALTVAKFSSHFGRTPARLGMENVRY